MFGWLVRARCAQPAPAIHALVIALQDPEGFVESGGWNFLDADQSDSEDGSEPESEFEPRYACPDARPASCFRNAASPPIALVHRRVYTTLPCSGSDDGESEDEESSEDESLVESDDDSEYGGEDEEEDEGLDWDELEAEAKADDKKREASDGEEDARARTKPRR
jgi:nucleosome binding factor SPN SPT16 subunit